jgi:hypothetical protein
LIDAANPATGDVYKNCQGVPYYNIQDDIDSGLISYAYARQEYLNDVVSHVVGGYYGHEMAALERRGAMHQIDPFSDLVYTFWDLGGVKEDSDKTCVLFAHLDTSGKKYRVIDYYENTGHKRGHYFEMLAQKGYNYAGHYFPHDAKRTNEWTGENTAETARTEFGIEIRFIPKTQNVLNDIEITRRGFANTEFDSERCEQVLTHLGNYHEKETTGRPCHQNNCQECQGASHGADTFRGMHMAIHLGLVEPYLVDSAMQYLPVIEEADDDWFLV